MQIRVTKEVDAKGLKCPLPILYAKKALNGIEAGDVLLVVATDPNSAKDFTLFCQQTGHVLMNLEEKGNETRIWIKKKPL